MAGRARGTRTRSRRRTRRPRWPVGRGHARQLVALIQPGFVTAAGWRHLRDLPRYLAGIGRRLEKLAANPARDRQWMDEVAQVRAEYDDLLAAAAPGASR